jgi:predicted metal-dependent hydrolase
MLNVIISVLSWAKDWIEKKLGEIENITQTYGNFDNMLLLNGAYYKITESSSCNIDTHTSTVTYTTATQFKEFLTKLIQNEVEEKVKHYTELIGVQNVKVSIKMQKTKWGSCSGRSNLNFNLAIIALPPHLQEYIVVHEVIHLLERNHSQAFWKKIAKFWPEYGKSEIDLKKYWILIERNSIWSVLRSLGKCN